MKLLGAIMIGFGFSFIMNIFRKPEKNILITVGRIVIGMSAITAGAMLLLR